MNNEFLFMELQEKITLYRSNVVKFWKTPS